MTTSARERRAGLPPLAELHVHLLGTVRARDHLARVVDKPIDWGWYERAFEQAYGVLPPVREILERHRAGDPAAAGDFESLFVFGEDDAGNFDRFQAKFNLLIAGSEFRRAHRQPEITPALAGEIRDVLASFRADQARQEVAYAEQRVFLGSRLATDTFETLAGGLLEEFARPARAGEPVVRLAISLPREDPWPQWEAVRRLALGRGGESLTAIDFCFVEEGHPPAAQAALFAAVHEFNDAHPERALAILYHVGESFRDKSLESAVRWVQEAAELGAHRLGHAIALGVDPATFGEHQRRETVAERRDQLRHDLRHRDGLARHGVHVDPAIAAAELSSLERRPPDDCLTIAYDASRLEEVRRRQDHAMECVRATPAVLEVCPTSNRRIAAIRDPDHHPVHRFLEHGLPVVVASDDPGIFGVTLAGEIDWVARAAGLDDDGVGDLRRQAWRSRSEVLAGRETGA